MPGEIEQIVLRLAPADKAWVEARARENCRSRNGEIVHLIKSARLSSQAAHKEALLHGAS